MIFGGSFCLPFMFILQPNLLIFGGCHLTFTVFSELYPAPVYSPQRGKFNNNCWFDNGYPAPVYTLRVPCVPALNVYQRTIYVVHAQHSCCDITRCVLRMILAIE